VSRALDVPVDIIRPDYILDPKSEFGIYEGSSTIHNESTIELLK